MTDRIKETQQLAKSYSIDFKDLGNGHVQLRAHGILVNYWPNSKRKAVHSPTLQIKDANYLPWDAIRLCLQHAKIGVKKSTVTKNPPAFSLKTVTTNPAGLKHFYSGDKPPWELTGEYTFNKRSDELRHQAYRLNQQAVMLRAEADEIDEAA